jgi:hypothetical protein
MQKERPLEDHEDSRPALALARRFIQRWDLHARQLDDGRYICVHEPLNVFQLIAHLRGKITLGAYLLDRKSQARCAVFDADDEQGFQRLLGLGAALSEEGVPTYLEGSRRGGHLWLFFAQAIPGQQARRFANGILSKHGISDVEIFPKQDRLSGGPGSMIRMPFGVHRLVGRRYGFFHSDGSSLAPTIREQIYALSAPQVVPQAVFEAYRSYAPSEPLQTSYERQGESTDTLSDRIKASITVLEFVSQYVNLKQTGSGAIGRCPFHDDRNPSFGVNDRGNYWNCFADCGGGSVIDFWMKWRNVDFTKAIRELANILF